MGSMLYRNVLWDCFAKRKLTHFPVQLRHRDLWIRGRERLRVRDLTSTFFAHFSQERDIPESFTLLIVHQKASNVIFTKGGQALFRSQKWQNFYHLITWFRNWDIFPKTRSRMTKTNSRQNDAGPCRRTLLSIGSISSLGCLDAPALLPPTPAGVAQAHRDTKGWRLSL